MHLTLRTPVSASPETVWAGFDRALFERLAPPFPPVDVVRFDGCQKGDVVHLRLNFLLFKQDWVSDITDQQRSDDEIYFVDEGTKLPFFLTYWHHRHGLQRSGTGTVIVDAITYRTPTRLTDWLFWPLLWAQFAYRKPIYRRIFGKR